jgi:methylisocitrate lyase
MRRSAETIASLSPSTPVIADADTGYGGPIMVARTVEQYSRSGVGALHIEDQVQTKRCGHLAGKILVDLKEYVARIRAAVQARRRIGSDIVIIARTDSIQKHGYEEALGRLRAARDAGADAAFPEGLRSVEEARRMIADLAPWPVLLNMVENSVTPKLSAKEAKNLGFSMMIVPLATLAPAYTAVKAGLQKLKETGSADTALTPQDLFRVCGLDESMKVDEEAGASNFEGGVDWAS